MKWLTLLPAVLAGFVAGLALFDPAPWRLVGPPPEATDHVILGYLELNKNALPSLERATGHFNDAVGVAEHCAAFAGLAETALARSEALSQNALSAPARAGELNEQASAIADLGFQHAKKALMLDPGNGVANRAMADYFRLKRSPDRMRSFLDAAAGSLDGDPMVRFVRAASQLSDAQRRDTVAGQLSKVLTSAPELQRARFMLAMVEAQRGNESEALGHVEALLARVPDHERALVLRERLGGAAPTINGETAPELALVEPIEAGPAGSGSTETGTVAAVPGPSAAPTEIPTESNTGGGAPTTEGEDFDTLFARAAKLRRQGRARAALPIYESALALQPDSAKALAGRGWCQLDIEEVEEAVESFRTILDTRPRAPGAHLGLAESYRELGKETKAIKHYQRYLDITPDGPEAETAQAAIAEMGGTPAE